jgi:hypothetical protein
VQCISGHDFLFLNSANTYPKVSTELLAWRSPAHIISAELTQFANAARASAEIYNDECLIHGRCVEWNAPQMAGEGREVGWGGGGGGGGRMITFVATLCEG